MGLKRWDSAAECALARDNHTVKQEFRVLFRLALPTIVQTASQQAMVFTDQIFLGHLGTEQMAAAALGNMYSAFLTFFLFGTATALDTLGSQAYGAAKKGIQGTSLVTWTFTSFVVLTVLCIPATIGLGLAYPVARTILGQDTNISFLIGEFCAGLIPGTWPLMWSVVLMKYLQVQNVVAAPAMVTAITFVINIASNFVFIDAMGFKGAPLATSFSRFLQFFALCYMVYVFEHTKGRRSKILSWVFQGADDIGGSQQAQHDDVGAMRSPDSVRDMKHGTHAHGDDRCDHCGERDEDGDGTKETDVLTGTHAASHDAAESGGHDVQALYKNEPKPHMTGGEMLRYIWKESKASVQPHLLWTYLGLGLPGGIMQSCEQGAFDVTTALAGRLGPVIVSAHSAMLNVVGLTFVSCPYAVGIAGSIRVGNLLGEAMPRTAKKAGWLSVAIGGTFMAICAVVILSTRNVIGRIFTTDMEVITVVASIVPMVALFQVSDGLMGCAQGVLRGCGKQRLLMVYNIVGFWLGGVLVGYLLCFHAHLGVKGLWWGIACGDTCTAILNVVTLSLVNWSRESESAQKLLTDQAENTPLLALATLPPSSGPSGNSPPPPSAMSFHPLAAGVSSQQQQQQQVETAALSHEILATGVGRPDRNGLGDDLDGVVEVEGGLQVVVEPGVSDLGIRTGRMDEREEQARQ